MITIGIRAAPKVVTFVVYDSDEQRILNIEDLLLPSALSTPEKLKYARSNLLDILREYNVDKAGIRETESAAQSLSVERIQLEGVIQEAFASSTLKAYYVGQISSISAKAGFPRDRFKRLVSGEEAYEIEDWGNLKEAAREAVLCAVGAVNA